MSEIVKQVIKNEEFTLRRFHPDFAQEVFDVVDSQRERLDKFLPWVKYVQSVEDEVNHFKNQIKAWQEERVYDYMIVVDGKFAGCIGAHTVSWENKQVELGYWINADFGGKGLMSKATKALMEHFFSIGFYRIEIRCDPLNIPSQNIPKRLGFIHEGTLRKNLMHKGELRDSMVWSKLRDD